METTPATPRSSAFSTIQLLTVILSIGVLLLIMVSFVNTARMRARDAKRLVDVRRMQTSLEYYQLDNGSYPVVEAPVTLGVGNAQKLCDAQTGGFVAVTAVCTREYMNPVPTDPNRGMYQYIGAAQGYTLSFKTEDVTTTGPAGQYFAHTQNINTDPTMK